MANKQIVVEVQAKRQDCKRGFCLNITTLICQISSPMENSITCCSCLSSKLFVYIIQPVQLILEGAWRKEFATSLWLLWRSVTRTKCVYKRLFRDTVTLITNCAILNNIFLWYIDGHFCPIRKIYIASSGLRNDFRYCQLGHSGFSWIYWRTH